MKGLGCGGLFQDGNQQGHAGFQDLVAPVDSPLYENLAFFEIENLLRIGDLGDVEFFCGLRPHLRGVTVDRLAAGENQVVGTKLLDGLAQGVRRRQCVRAAKFPVGDQVYLVGTHVQAFAQQVTGLRGSHRDRGDLATEAIAQLEGQLEGHFVVGVEDGR